ncbi:hypothetical protein HWV62_22076 [Athelia sp. TMB]|nr:hypothetical protein HWV62_22076 [Athelia sp. TMB]
MSLLTLDETTLFYWNLSNTYLKNAHSVPRDITTWMKDVQDTKPSSRRSSATPSMTTARSRTSQSTASRPPRSIASQASALSNGIKISGLEEENLMEKGAISDCDETTGVEYEAKKASPVKGKVRLTSSHKVKIEPGTPAPKPAARKTTRPINKTLPEKYQEGTIWKTRVIPTLIKYVGTHRQIFKVPAVQLAKTLQIICRFYYDDERITIQPGDLSMHQASQKLFDQRGSVGSSAIAFLLAYLASCPVKKDSDEERVEWCKDQLSNYRFIYADTTNPDSKRWKRAYQSPIILQCFAVYYAATKSSRWLAGMYPNSQDSATKAPEPRPALALAAAAAERALKFVAEGRITLATIEANKNGTDFLIYAGRNPHTGKRLVGSISFSEDLWGNTVEDYQVSLDKLKTSHLDAIIKAARAYMRVINDLNDDGDTVTYQRPVAKRSSRAHIELGYDDDSDEGEDGEVEEQRGKNVGAILLDREHKRELYTMEEQEEMEELDDPYANDPFDDDADEAKDDEDDFDNNNGNDDNNDNNDNNDNFDGVILHPHGQHPYDDSTEAEHFLDDGHAQYSDYEEDGMDVDKVPRYPSYFDNHGMEED